MEPLLFWMETVALFLFISLKRKQTAEQINANLNFYFYRSCSIKGARNVQEETRLLLESERSHFLNFWVGFGSALVKTTFVFLIMLLIRKTLAARTLLAEC